MSDRSSSCGREAFQNTFFSVQLHRLRADPSTLRIVSRTLEAYRYFAEGREESDSWLCAALERVPLQRPMLARDKRGHSGDHVRMAPERGQRLCATHEDELMRQCGVVASEGTSAIDWEDFLEYVDKKKAELRSLFHHGPNLDNGARLHVDDLAETLGKAGVTLDTTTLTSFMTFLTSSHLHMIGFQEFLDFLTLLPRYALIAEIYRFYQVTGSMGNNSCGSAGVNAEGGVSLGVENHLRMPNGASNNLSHENVSEQSNSSAIGLETSGQKRGSHGSEQPQDEQKWFNSSTAKYLFAGGVAGMVSRTATAPFDRLKIFLITRPPDLGGLTGVSAVTPTRGLSTLLHAVVRIYSEGGIRAFWVGNALNLVKIFPESAVKFMTYERTKILFAKYWDRVDDPRNISGSSRFISGGAGGIVSQLFIYPIETLKTQMMSSTGDQTRSVGVSMRRLWVLGGTRAYYRGLTIGILGVFPYSAIDMSTFEALKLAYVRSTAKEEPGVLALLAFGSISGSIGATSVYPLNLVRTRLQASGSSGHPERYSGAWDVVTKTFQRDGWRGFYRGLFPTLAKVVPGVSISYVVYENTKRRLGV